MTIKHSIAKTLNKLLSPFDLHLGRLSEYPFKSLSLEASLRRLKVKGIEPITIIDVGASDGRWTENVKVCYPDSHYYLIEANSIHQEALVEFVRKHTNCAFKIAAAADTVGEIYFDNSDPFTGLASHEITSEHRIQVPCTTIDAEVEANDLKGPYLLKLDTHGFEVPIFNGAKSTLLNTNIIIVETYNFDLTKESLKFWEICDFLEKKGFRPVDMMEPMFRPKDESLWQMDLVFIRSERAEFQVNTYD